MRILDRVPIGDRPVLLFVGTDAVTVKRYQMVAWASMLRKIGLTR